MREGGKELVRGVFDLWVSFDGMFYGIAGTRNLSHEFLGSVRRPFPGQRSWKRLACF
jgi:hypothetical protein